MLLWDERDVGGKVGWGGASGGASVYTGGLLCHSLDLLNV